MIPPPKLLFGVSLCLSFLFCSQPLNPCRRQAASPTLLLLEVSYIKMKMVKISPSIAESLLIGCLWISISSRVFVFQHKVSWDFYCCDFCTILSIKKLSAMRDRLFLFCCSSEHTQYESHRQQEREEGNETNEGSWIFMGEKAVWERTNKISTSAWIRLTDRFALSSLYSCKFCLCLSFYRPTYQFLLPLKSRTDQEASSKSWLTWLISAVYFFSYTYAKCYRSCVTAVSWELQP